MKKVVLKFIKITGIISALAVSIVIVYFIYCSISYYRLEDCLTLQVENPSEIHADMNTEVLQIEESYSIATYNLGFGAYVPDFSFFMDGGLYSRAKSKQSVIEAVSKGVSLVKDLDTDFVLFQEVDVDGDRSHHVDQYSMIKEQLTTYYSDYAQNFDSFYIIIPLNEPHGKNKSGIATFSKYSITDAVRRSLPVADSLSKWFDLDRCYSVSKIPVQNGKELVLINLHASAYGTSDNVRHEQVSMLREEMEKEYQKGNYVICGGDFNHDLKEMDENKEHIKSWAYPFPRSSLPEHFSFTIDMLSEEERNEMWDSARDNDKPFTEGESFTITLDGFIISDNVKQVDYQCIKTGYAYSDHEPVVLQFQLKEE